MRNWQEVHRGVLRVARVRRRRLCIWPCSVPAPALVLPLIPGIHQAGQVEGLALRRGLPDRAVCLGRQRSCYGLLWAECLCLPKFKCYLEVGHLGDNLA